MTSRLAVSTSRTSTEVRRPVNSSSTGAKPSARTQRDSGLLVPDSVDDDGVAAPIAVGDPHDGGQGTERRPGSHRVGALGEPEVGSGLPGVERRRCPE